jgi:hypothetical protein
VLSRTTESYVMRRTWIDRSADYIRLRRTLRDLKPGASIQCRDVHAILEMNRLIQVGAGEIVARIANSIDYPATFGPKCHGIAKLTVFYLSERVAVTPFQIINAVTRDPFYAHADVAALNRGLFETAVNLLYLLGPDSDIRFRSFYHDSAERELSLQKTMQRWLQSADKQIRRRAEHQYGIRNGTTSSTLEKVREFTGDVPKYPNLRERCRQLGETWDFNYDSRYRGLSSWQHGDASRILVAQAFQQIFPDDAERPVFESLSQCAWAWDAVHLLVTGLLRHSKRADEDGEKLDALDRFGQTVLSHHVGRASTKFQG